MRIPEIDGIQRNVWLTQSAFVPDAPSNLVSTSMLNKHGVYLSERTRSLENRNGQSLYFLGKRDTGGTKYRSKKCRLPLRYLLIYFWGTF